MKRKEPESTFCGCGHHALRPRLREADRVKSVRFEHPIVDGTQEGRPAGDPDNRTDGSDNPGTEPGCGQGAGGGTLIPLGRQEFEFFCREKGSMLVLEEWALIHLREADIELDLFGKHLRRTAVQATAKAKQGWVVSVGPGGLASGIWFSLSTAKKFLSHVDI